MVCNSQFYTDTRVNFFELQREMNSLQHKLNGQINAVELKDSIVKIEKLGLNLLEGYSKQRALSEIFFHLNDVKTKLHEIVTLFQENKTSRKIEIVFESSIKEPQQLQKQLLDKYSSSLIALESKIADVQTYGTIVNHFTKSCAFLEKFAIQKEKFIHALFGFLTDKISSFIFQGYEYKVTLERSQTMIASLSQQEEIQKQKIAAIQQNNPPIEQTIIEKENATLFAIQQKKAKLLATVDYLNSNNALAKNTRIDMQVIGGQNVKIHNPQENVSLDGMYLSSDAFKARLKEDGAQICTMSIMSLKGEVIELKGLSFPQQAFNNDVLDRTLTSLGAFDLDDKAGAGWKKITFDGHILIIDDETAKKLTQMDVIVNNNIELHKTCNVSVTDLDTTKPSTGGTVLLTSGNTGVYEMHKREILAFLMRGMNVMTFNFRGYGESTGKPSGEGLKRDMESAYEYLKKIHNIPDEKILIKRYA